jgi:hypothetical protein
MSIQAGAFAHIRFLFNLDHADVGALLQKM